MKSAIAANAVRIFVPAIAVIELTVIQPIAAQQPAPVLLVTYVSLSPLEETGHFSTRLVLEAPDMDGHDCQRLLTRRHELTMGERWEKFEKEFGIRERSPSRFKSMLQSLMYSVDETLFVAKHLADNIDDALDFEYHFARPKLPKGTFKPRRNSLDSAYAKFNVDLKPTRATAGIGVKLVVPLGN